MDFLDAPSFPGMNMQYCYPHDTGWLDVFIPGLVIASAVLPRRHKKSDYGVTLFAVRVWVCAPINRDNTIKTFNPFCRGRQHPTKPSGGVALYLRVFISHTGHNFPCACLGWGWCEQHEHVRNLMSWDWIKCCSSRGAEINCKLWRWRFPETPFLVVSHCCCSFADMHTR